MSNTYQGRLIVGAFLISTWVLLYFVPGIVFQGSVLQVQSACVGPFAGLMPPDSCSLAKEMNWPIWIIFGAGVACLIRGTYRWYRVSSNRAP